MRKYGRGWFRDTHRHYLAAKYGSAGPKRYMATGGWGGALMGSAHDLGASKFSLMGSFQRGEAVTPVSSYEGEALLPRSFGLGQNWTPDVKMLGGNAEDKYFMSGSQVMGKFFGEGSAIGTSEATGDLRHELHELSETPEEEAIEELNPMHQEMENEEDTFEAIKAQFGRDTFDYPNGYYAMKEEEPVKDEGGIFGARYKNDTFKTDSKLSYAKRKGNEWENKIDRKIEAGELPSGAREEFWDLRKDLEKKVMNKELSLDQYMDELNSKGKWLVERREAEKTGLKPFGWSEDRQSMWPETNSKSMWDFKA